MSDLVDLLSRLIAHPTQNPAGDEPALAALLADELTLRRADEVAVVEVPRVSGDGKHAYVYARYGVPRWLVNAHLDTVPPNAGWSANPFRSRRVDDKGVARVHGLGACDIKGAIAASLAALDDERPADLAILYSGDEEHGGSCMRAFLDGPRGRQLLAARARAIVCEPTSCRVGTRHRGIVAIECRVAGKGGHSSRADQLPSPIASLARLAVACDDWGRARRLDGPPGFTGTCMNVAQLDGGVAFNVVPDEARLVISVRPPPGTATGRVVRELLELASAIVPDAKTRVTVENPSFAAGDLRAFAGVLPEAARPAEPVDLAYWTEAALLSAAGIDAVVFGPGDIAQAHAPDEWVPVAELERAREVFAHLYRASREEAALEPAEVVLRFLESISRRSETDFYLGLFRALPKERFAVISVDANVARHASEAVVLDLRFLAALGLHPVVLLGLSDGGESLEHAARIRRRLDKAGVPAVILAPEDPDFASRAADATRSGRIPILAFGADGPYDTPDLRLVRLGELLTTLATRKMIFLHRRGALRTRAGARHELVNLTTEYEALLTSRDLSKKERMLVGWSRRLVFELVPHKLLVAVTSPLDLLRELFTVKGAGTLLRRGAVIEKRAGLRDASGAVVDVERLRALLARSFGRPPREEFFARPISRLYLEEGYRGAAILVDTPLGAYLTKFAVEREAQGEGMGRDLWDLVAAEYPKVYWRARPANPIGDWYARLCNGLVRLPEWNVYWKGLAPSEIAAAIAYAEAQPVDILPAEPLDRDGG